MKAQVSKKAPSKSQELLEEVQNESNTALRERVKEVIRIAQKGIFARQGYMKARLKQIDQIVKVQEDVLLAFDNGELTEDAVKIAIAHLNRMGLSGSGDFAAAPAKPTKSKSSYKEEDEDEWY